VRHRAKNNFIKNRSKRLQRYGGLTIFQDGDRSPSLARIGTNHDGLLVVSIVRQNLVEIDGVVLIILNFQYFARLA